VGLRQERGADQDVGQTGLLFGFGGVVADGVVAGGVDGAGVLGDDRGAVGEAHIDDDLAAVRGDVDVLGMSEAGLQVHGVQAEPQPSVHGIAVAGSAGRAVQLSQRRGEVGGRRDWRGRGFGAAEEPDARLAGLGFRGVDQSEQGGGRSGRQ
jgi:hypothetical protein